LYKVYKTIIDTIYIKNEKIYLCEYNKKKYKLTKNTIATIKYIDCKELDKIKPDVCFEYIFGWYMSLGIRFNSFAFRNSMLVGIKAENETWNILHKRVPLPLQVRN
jgi:hypothetical protein